MTAASFSVANAYIADVTPPELRAARYGMIGAAFGAGFIIGPALGGLLGSDDPRLPFWVAAGFSLVNAAYGVFVLPESLPLSKRAPFSWRRANPLGSLTLLRSHRELFGLASASFLNSLAHAALPSVTVLYMTFRYGWDARMIGFSMTFIGACALVVQGGLIGRFVAHFGDRAALITGLAFGVAPRKAWRRPPGRWPGDPAERLWVIGPDMATDEALAFSARLRLERPAVGVVLIRDRVDVALLKGCAVRDSARSSPSAIATRWPRRNGPAMFSHRVLARAGQQEAAATGEIITVFAPKGGVGKTTLATNLGVVLAKFAPSTGASLTLTSPPATSR